MKKGRRSRTGKSGRWIDPTDAQRIRDITKKAMNEYCGGSQTAFAARSGQVSQPMLSHFLNGDSGPGLKVLRGLAGVSSEAALAALGDPTMWDAMHSESATAGRSALEELGIPRETAEEMLRFVLRLAPKATPDEVKRSVAVLAHVMEIVELSPPAPSRKKPA